MTAILRRLTLTMAALLTVFGLALAQNDDGGNGGNTNDGTGGQLETRQVGGEEFVPYGEAEIGEPEPYETNTEQVDVEVETGAIIFTATTPDDQHPNVDLVGPNGFYQHFEIEDEDGAEHVVEGLLPGVYSVAATDDGMQMVHTLVEVVRGQAVTVNFNMMAVDEFVAGAMAERDVGARTFPDEGFETAGTAEIDSAEFGELAIETDDENAQFVVTGPDNYSREFTGAFTASDLMPGVYTVAATKDGAEIATTTVEVQVSTATTFVPTLAITAETEEVDGGVTGGGEGEGAETDNDDGTTDMGAQDDAAAGEAGQNDANDTQDDATNQDGTTDDAGNDDAGTGDEENQQQDDEQNQ